ncbi:tRNA-splicing endonuclease subunit Sen34 [Brachionus plicatilis]|uniref:tRNA-intron lyase n=1 Tax=Brachionus plicatilis TaxID=10195 RepID=A0A3M7QS58_BRAPC|nr:tRNA-splicing endonuclease subunit Sen34 [Brachionus plicatilis]
MFKSKIKIYEINSESLSDGAKSYLVLENEASDYLRETKRICSRKIGTWCNNQTTQSFLPLQLATEEVCLLTELFHNEIEIIKTNFTDLKNFEKNDKFDQFKSNYESYLANLNSKQIKSFKENRKKQMIAKKDQILNGKRKKIAEQLDKIRKNLLRAEINQDEMEKLNQQKNTLEYNLDNLELNFEQELNNVGQSGSFYNEVEIFHSTPEFYKFLFKTEEIPIEHFRITFKYLYTKGYYLTSGAKFGGDFLVYPGNPTNYHSKFILICFDSEQEYNSLSLKKLITYARMATTTQKGLIFENIKRRHNPKLQTDLNIISCCCRDIICRALSENIYLQALLYLFGILYYFCLNSLWQTMLTTPTFFVTNYSFGGLVERCLKHPSETENEKKNCERKRELMKV